MKISVSEVNKLNNQLRTKIKTYESKYLQYYNYMNQAGLDWYDTNSLKFFETIEEDKKNDYYMLQDLTSIYKIYDYIEKKYKEIGNEIYYDPASHEKIDEILNSIIEKCDRIVDLYNNIELYNYSERSMLYYQKNIFINILAKTKNIKKSIQNNISKIEQIENQVIEKLSKIVIKPIQEKDITPYK